ncbi:redoxin family protein [Cryptosporangium japonicum]|uniref:Thioredoxin domain-containing protein n=1 Tax=Cryptosporangium japonicum TaxID=80872 RepID=A0ABP3E007_9ACTN
MTRLAVGENAPWIPAANTVTVVVFTSLGCPYAQAWHDRIQAVGRDYAAQGVELVQVISNDPTHRPEDARPAAPFVHDADQAFARAFGATATPEVFVLDRDGVVRYHGAPDGDYDDPARDAEWVRAALDDVLAGRNVRRPWTSPAGCSIKWRVELLWWDGCPSRGRAADLLRDTLADLGRDDVTVVERQIRNRADATDRSFPGSPTFQVGRRDLFPTATEPSLTCRVYRRADGRSSPLPGADELSTALREALARPWDLPGWVDHRKETAS